MSERVSTSLGPTPARSTRDLLQDLEDYVANHSEARLARIRDVGRQLADAHIMPDWIRAEIDALGTRWNDLRAQVIPSYFNFVCRIT